MPVVESVGVPMGAEPRRSNGLDAQVARLRVVLCVGLGVRVMALSGFSFRLISHLVAGLAVLSATGLALLVGGAHSANDSSQLIAFTRADGIYVIRADGSDERPLRRGGAAAGANRLAWSPDGLRLAFTNTKNAVWAMNADGSHVVRLVAGADIAATLMGPLAWSPDGDRIAFTAFQRSATGVARNWEIWVVNADGTNAHPLRRTPHLWEFDVDWNPAGDRIAFTDLHGGSMWSPFRVMTTKGKTLRSVDPGSAHNTAMPDWTPDGRRLAFIKWPNRTNDGGIFRKAEIWITTSSGSTRQLTRNTVSDSSPAWSPDGSKIAFLRGSDDILLWPKKHSPSEVYLMNADGTHVTRLTHNTVGEGSPAWQPVSTS